MKHKTDLQLRANIDTEDEVLYRDTCMRACMHRCANCMCVCVFVNVVYTDVPILLTLKVGV